MQRPRQKAQYARLPSRAPAAILPTPCIPRLDVQEYRTWETKQHCPNCAIGFAWDTLTQNVRTCVAQGCQGGHAFSRQFQKFIGQAGLSLKIGPPTLIAHQGARAGRQVGGMEIHTLRYISEWWSPTIARYTSLSPCPASFGISLVFLFLRCRSSTAFTMSSSAHDLWSCSFRCEEQCRTQFSTVQFSLLVHPAESLYTFKEEKASAAYGLSLALLRPNTSTRRANSGLARRTV